MEILIANPIPKTLAHYVVELEEVISALGHELIIEDEYPSIEGVSRASKPMTTVRLLAARRRLAKRDSDITLVVWPALGSFESLTWGMARPRHRVIIVEHDPAPLSRTYGTGMVSSRFGRLGGSTSNVMLLAHTHRAAAELKASRGHPVHLARHPILAPNSRPKRASSSRVLVLGQYKDARDISLLHRLGPLLVEAGLEPVIFGRGWPKIDGWAMETRFLSEAEFDAELDNAGVLLVTYKYFYQSGVAVRAVERGTPVVGPAHPFLEDLLGPGVLLPTDASDNDWVQTVLSAVATSTPAEVQESYFERVISDWENLFNACA